jgi:hypothetical protein
MDASSTRPTRSVAASVRARSGIATRASAPTEIAPTRAVSPPSALDSAQQDLDKRSGGNQREASPPLTDPIGRALLDVLAGDDSHQHDNAQAALLRAKAYSRPADKPTSTS